VGDAEVVASATVNADSDADHAVIVTPLALLTRSAEVCVGPQIRPLGHLSAHRCQLLSAAFRSSIYFLQAPATSSK
jgi:hypothetical protein